MIEEKKRRIGNRLNRVGNKGERCEHRVIEANKAGKKKNPRATTIGARDSERIRVNSAIKQRDRAREQKGEAERLTHGKEFNDQRQTTSAYCAVISAIVDVNPRSE